MVEVNTKQETGYKVLRIGDALIAAGLVSAAKIEFVLQKQLVTGEKLGELFLRMGVVSEYDIARLLAEQRSIPLSDVDNEPAPDAGILNMFNQEFCLHRAFLPLRREGEDLVVVVGNADYDQVEQAINQRTGLRCRILQGEFSKVLRAVRHYYYFAKYPVQELCLKETKRLEKDADQVLTPDALLDHLFHLAVKQRATDIHIQPEPKSFHISFRIDGVLRPVFAISRKLKRLIASLKMQAGMDISDNLRPQDGSFSVTILDLPFDIRMSTVVTEYGENIVLRLLPSGMQVKGLNQLGFFDKDLASIDELFANPYGILLMTGPTGAGKSTTLHAGLRVAGMDGKNILTVEDPIEYKLPIVCQTQVNRKAGYLFNTAITHFLRHDPDVMLLGEIRDAETAKAAITAAETGHLVLSTLHEMDTFLDIMKRNTMMAFAFMENSNHFILNLVNKMEGLLVKHHHGRVAEALLYLSLEIYQKNPFELSISRKELSEMTGLSKESVSRILHEFTNEGLIQITGKTFHLLKKDSLEQISRNG